MDWEIFLGLVGLYILAIASLYHQFIVTRRIINLTSTVMKTLTERRELIMKEAQKRMENKADDSEEK